MTLRRLAVLQWVGLLLGAGVWAAQHVVGWGVTEATCNGTGAGRGIGNDLWQASLMAVAGAFVVLAGLAAFAVVRGTRELSYEDAPPAGRMRFLAIAAIAADAIFLVIILLDGFASIFDVACRQA